MTPWSEEIILNELNSGKVNPIRWFIKLGKKKKKKKHLRGQIQSLNKNGSVWTKIVKNILQNIFFLKTLKVS